MPTGIYERTERHKQILRKIAERNDGCFKKGQKGIRSGMACKPETKEKLSAKLKGSKYSEEHRQHIMEKLNTPEVKEKMSGENNPRWIDGRTAKNSPYPKEWTEILKDSIRARDEYVCKLCGIHQEELTGFLKKLDIHHIDYNKDNLDPKNLITLCRKCHIKTNSDRGYWVEFFSKGEWIGIG